jgi:2',3'-cyclic-nucleotide 2'-phosphodiesterase (5'-nucleotidase family)
MMRSTTTSKLLSFPLSTPVPEAAAQNWRLRILETTDNLENALDYLRDEYNAMLAGEPITAADEILARVETILRNSQKVSWYTVVAKIRIHAPTSRDAKRKVLLRFPALKMLQ